MDFNLFEQKVFSIMGGVSIDRATETVALQDGYASVEGREEGILAFYESLDQRQRGRFIWIVTTVFDADSATEILKRTFLASQRIKLAGEVVESYRAWEGDLQSRQSDLNERERQLVEREARVDQVESMNASLRARNRKLHGEIVDLRYRISEIEEAEKRLAELKDALVGF